VIEERFERDHRGESLMDSYDFNDVLGQTRPYVVHDSPVPDSVPHYHHNTNNKEINKKARRKNFSELIHKHTPLQTEKYTPHSTAEPGYTLLDYNNPPSEFRYASNLALHDDKDFKNFQRDLHTSNIQPSSYSKNELIEPISANMGISYDPSYQYVEKSHRDVTDGDGHFNPDGIYTYTSIDPQLVREDGPANRLEESPSRNAWSQKYSSLTADPGTVRLDEIYDPRFTGAGDGYRSYHDELLGQVRYYYGDVDAYRRPNYIVRSKIDNFDFATPMGAVLPDFVRTPLESNSRELAETQFLRDTINHRENLMESALKKINSNSWQTRYAPIDGSSTGRSK